MAEPEVSLSDHYVILLTDVVNENKELRRQLAENHQQDQQSMSKMSEKIEALTSKVASSRGRVRPTGGGTALRVPKLCSVSGHELHTIHIICVYYLRQ